jgi:hypothetical protein
MTRGPGDAASQLQELVSRALRQQVRSNQRFADLLRRIASGELNGEEVRNEFRQFSEAEASEYIRSLTGAGVNFFSHLLDLNDSFNERFFQRFGENGSRPDETASPHRARMPLHGPAGSLVKAEFIVENRRDVDSDVSISFPKVNGPDGASFQAPFVAEPASFRLHPGEERPVRISLQLLPELFVVGEPYSCEVLVRGPENMLLNVEIVAEPAIASNTEDEPIETAAAPAQRPASKRRGVKRKSPKRAAKSKASAKTARKAEGGKREGPPAKKRTR